MGISSNKRLLSHLKNITKSMIVSEQATSAIIKKNIIWKQLKLMGWSLLQYIYTSCKTWNDQAIIMKVSKSY